MSIGVFSSVIVSFDASFCSLCLLKITRFSKGETAVFLPSVGRPMLLNRCFRLVTHYTYLNMEVLVFLHLNTQIFECS